LQAEHAPNLSTPAKLIKIGDKTCNLSEITPTQPAECPLQRKLEYLDWAKKVVSGCRDCNLDLEQHFDAVLKRAESRWSDRIANEPRGCSHCTFVPIPCVFLIPNRRWRRATKAAQSNTLVNTRGTGNAVTIMHYHSEEKDNKV
jgi:hypothetical protein